jgi:hypothetical protein
MDTGIVDDMKLPIDVEHGQSFAIHFGDNAMSWFHVGRVGDPYEFSHTSTSCAEDIIIDS